MDSLLIRKQLWFFYWATFRNTTSTSMAAGDVLQEAEQKQQFHYKHVGVKRNTEHLRFHTREWLQTGAGDPRSPGRSLLRESIRAKLISN